MNELLRRLLPLLATAVLAGGCSMTRQLKDGELLHYETQLELNTPLEGKAARRLESELSVIPRPEPLPKRQKWRVSLYNRLTRKPQKEKGFRHWLQTKVARPPVLYQADRIERSRLALLKRLYDEGFFHAEVAYDTLSRGRKVWVRYEIGTGQPYRLRQIEGPEDSLPLAQRLEVSQENSFLQPGQAYRQSDLAAERQRLADLANDLGYFKVRKNHFYFFVDTALGSNEADLYWRLNVGDDSTILQTYYHRNDWIYADHRLDRPADAESLDTVAFGPRYFLQSRQIVRPGLLNRVFREEAQLRYSRQRQEALLSRLQDLGIYRFINLQVQTGQDGEDAWLDRRFLLTPGFMQDVLAEFQSHTRSGSYLGLGASLTYAHKNAFRGAERFDLSLSGGVETQLNNPGELINTVDLSAQASIALPKVLAPFRLRTYTGSFVPRTQFSLADNYQRRTGFYNINSFSLKFGYDWRTGPGRRHQLYPASISHVDVFGQTMALAELFESDPRLEKSFEDVFLLGLTYNYTATTQGLQPGRPYSYLRFGFESSGNVPYLLASAFTGGRQQAYELFSVPFSQYLRGEIDYRYYLPKKATTLVARVGFGIGLPYGNSEVLPYLKQFSIGGSNSLRAFAFRSVGPGSYQRPAGDGSENDFIDQTGDLKLELNLEYRFPLIGYLKGAAFVDAGNIWLLRDLEGTQPEGVFAFGRFPKELALGAGLGLRFDLNFIVLRLDGALPLRRPYPVDGSHWTFSQIQLLEKDWRRDNLRFHFGIGYPF